MEIKSINKYCYTYRSNHTYIVEFAKNTVHQKSMLSSFQNTHNQLCNENCEGSIRSRGCVLCYQYKCCQTQIPVYEQRSCCICQPLKGKPWYLLWHSMLKATSPTFTPFSYFENFQFYRKIKRSV